MPVTENTLENNYEHYYETASFIPQQEDEEELDCFVAIANKTGKNLAILDIGCAEGRLSALLAKSGHDVTAADISNSFLQQAGRTAAASGVAVRTMYCDIEKDIAGFGGGKFDMIYFMDIIEHVRSPIRALGNLRRLLKENGSLVISTPNLCSFSQFYRYFKHPKQKADFFDPANLGDLHLQGYDYLTLEKALNFSGLQIGEVIPGLIKLPVVYRFRRARPFMRWCAKKYPLLSENLLVKCKVVGPVDLEKQISFWRKKYTEKQ
jgi:SAM-dependent methyltransferase